MTANKKPFLCKIGLHKMVEISTGKTETYHMAFNPVMYKRYICTKCEKTKTIHYQTTSSI